MIGRELTWGARRAISGANVTVRRSIPCVLVALLGCAAPGSPNAKAPLARSDAPPAATASAPLASEAPSATPDPIQAAIDADARPDSDRADDANRKPHEVLSFYGITPGMKVADLMCGRGYYTEILARAVGPEGTVYCQNNAFVVERFADGPLRERLAKPDLGNVVRLDRELENPGLPAGEIDVALMVLFYHDTYWQKTDRAKMNAAVFDALKPGGLYGVVDHHAAPGSGDRDVKTLHRIDADHVKREVLAAGFVFEGQSDVLSHPEDDRTKNVFDEAIRRRTDRFVYAFRKPPGDAK